MEIAKEHHTRAPPDGDYCKALRKAKQSRVVSVQNVKQ